MNKIEPSVCVPDGNAIGVACQHEQRVSSFNLRLRLSLLLCFVLIPISLFAQQEFWHQAGLDGHTVWSLYVDSHGHLFAGSGLNAGLTGIVRSTNRGADWTQVAPWLARAFVENSQGIIFAGTSGGLARSTDDGNTWTIIDNISVVSFAKDAVTGTLYGGSVGSTAVVYHSTDDGMTWYTENTGIPSGLVTALVVAKNGSVFASVDQYGVFKSIDVGYNWMSVVAQGKRLWAMCKSHNNSIFVGTGDLEPLTQGMYRSTDNGDTWDSLGFAGYAVRSLTSDTVGNIYSGTFGGGIFLSQDNGEHWVQFNDGLLDSRVMALAVNSYGEIFAGTAEGGVFRGSSISERYQRSEGWNLVSVPLGVVDYRKTSLFPFAASKAFTYESGYVVHDTLRNGIGYWLSMERRLRTLFPV